MISPPVTIDYVRRATRQVMRSVDDLTDLQAEAPSRLPGWSRGEVLAHLARNADAITGMIEAVRRGDPAVMYPGGPAQRSAGIAAGRGERADALRSDIRRSCDRLAEAWSLLDEKTWNAVGGTASSKRPMHEMPWVRWRELEVHHVDLDVGYETSDWPVAFVSALLEESFSTFRERSASARPPVDADYRIVSIDHERAWRVELRGARIDVQPDDGEPVDGEARGWGCDVAAWLYGRDPRGGGIVASGDLGVLRLPQWFPFT